MTSTTSSLPPSASARPGLTRSRTDSRIAGVCGGLAEHTGIDALVWRVAMIALTLAGGTGIVVYGLLWLLMPAADQAV
jgi:phage shock protein PspC (stress-responsive transcriptional regulator)